jgi:cytochrome c peroxidase
LKTFTVIFILLGLAGAGIFSLDSCRKKEELHYTTALSFSIPPGFPSPLYNFQNNPLNEESFLLGRKLFYDGRLSVDNSHSCASCHNQVAAFTTFDHDRSHGINGSHTLRNAPALFNLAWYPYYNLDGSRPTLESVSLSHITSSIDMGENMDHVIQKLSADTVYKRLFRAAYGNETISSERIFNALKQFLLNLVSANTRYDKMLKGEVQFNPQEENGYLLFKANCAVCHKEPLFTDFSFRNIGLPADASLHDYGRMRVTTDPVDSLKFRIPSLRNLDYSAYFTHDGRISTYRMVIRHYRNGIVQSATLDPLLANGIQLTNGEEDDLVLFLQTLKDSSFINNPRFHE